MTQNEALKLALEALESCNWVDDGGYGHAEYDHVSTNKAITAIREALEQPEQEPVVCKHRIVDVTNEAIKSGYMCMDCGALFGAHGIKGYA